MKTQFYRTPFQALVPPAGSRVARRGTNIFARQISQSIQSGGIPASVASKVAPSAHSNGNGVTTSPTGAAVSQNNAAKVTQIAPTVVPSFLGPPGAPSAGTLGALSVLDSALQSAGIDPNSLGMVAHDDIAAFPGGSWVNHLITLTAGGHVESFSTDLMMLNPNVAVTEIKHLIGVG